MDFITKRKHIVLSIIIMCSLMAVYMVSITASIWNINQRIYYIVYHPYRVGAEIGNIREVVTHNSRNLPILLADNEKDIDEIRADLRASNEKNQKSLEIIKQRYLSNPKDIVVLEAALRDFDMAMLRSIDVFENQERNLQDVSRYFEREIEPLRLQVEDAVKTVKAFSSNKVLELRDKADESSQRAIVYAVALGILLLVFTFYLLRNENSRNEELNRRQEILQDALISAKKANDAKRAFLSRMSHEIRTPMNAIIGMTTIAFKYLDDQKRLADCLSKITFSSKHLLMLINDVLDMSKIEDGKLNVNNEIFDLKKLVESLIDIHYPQAIAKDQSFEVVISGFEEEKLIGDPLRVNQILINLLSNAIKFTPKGGKIKLDIKKLRCRRDKIWLRFVVQDNGIGMKQEFLEHLYEPFEQADNGVAKKYGGTGLGMAITKNLVSLMDGAINVKSEENVGTSFSVDLPFGLPKTEATANPTLDELKVLVVDDDRDCCEHTSILLEKMGVYVDWVLNGYEAVGKVRTSLESGQGCYDVCFIDWCMPDLNGVETAKRIREYVGPDTLIIIISAYDWSAIEQQARAAGVDAFIPKPFFASTLYNTLLTVSQKGELNIEAIESAKANYEFHGQKILLAEDNDLNAEIAVELLHLVGLEVDCAENGQEALDMFLQSAPDEYALVLMDIQMPVMNGYDAAKAMRNASHAAASNIPIIAMTANAFRDDVQAALDAGMNGHLPKPIDVDVLYQTIAGYVK